MALKLPDLANKNYQQLLDEMIASIPKYGSQWTNYNPSDPGIMLLELLTWITETTLYRINHIPFESYINFLRLLSGSCGQKLKHDIADTKIKLRELEKRWLETLGIYNEASPVDLSKYTKESEIHFYDLSRDLQIICNFLWNKIGIWTQQQRQDILVLLQQLENIVLTQLQRYDENYVALQKFLERVEQGQITDVLELKKAALLFLHSRYRAVTEDDFCQLAIDATRDLPNPVKKALVLQEQGEEQIKIIAITGKKTPDPQVAKILKDYFYPRKLLATRLVIEVPVYVPVEVTIKIIGDATQELIWRYLQRYFDPLIGGPQQQGWQYQRPVNIYEIMALVQQLSGVEEVLDVILKDDRVGKTMAGFPDLQKLELVLCNY